MVAVSPRCCMETNKPAEIGSSASAWPCNVEAGALLRAQPVWSLPQAESGTRVWWQMRRAQLWALDVSRALGSLAKGYWSPSSPGEEKGVQRWCGWSLTREPQASSTVSAPHWPGPLRHRGLTCCLHALEHPPWEPSGSDTPDLYSDFQGHCTMIWVVIGQRSLRPFPVDS